MRVSEKATHLEKQVRQHRWATVETLVHPITKQGLFSKDRGLRYSSMRDLTITLQLLLDQYG